jgi:hypothetical protein
MKGIIHYKLARPKQSMKTISEVKYSSVENIRRIVTRNAHLECRKENGMITLIGILRYRNVGAGWEWLRIMSGEGQCNEQS